MTVEPNIVAPVKKGQTFGSAEVKLGDSVVAQRPLVALQDVAEGSLWQRLSDSVLLWFQ